jgi:uncharacterized protein YndB with AHSA1/START domain
MTDRIEKTIELKAPIERVWRALSDYREFGTWFRVEIEAQFEAGKAARGKMSFSGREFIWNAVIKRMDAPEHFAFTWHPYAVDPDRDYSGEPQTLIEFTLKATDTGTHLTVVESGFDSLPEGRRDEAWRMNDGGWTQQLGNIRDHVGA